MPSTTSDSTELQKMTDAQRNPAIADLEGLVVIMPIHQYFIANI